MTAATPAGAEPTLAPADACTLCGSPMATDQEWCLDCGAARTVLRPPPDPRLPLTAAGVVVLAALIAFLVAVTHLGSAPKAVHRTAVATRTVTVTRASTTTTPATTTGPRPGPIASWPAGLSGWTVALATTPEESVARRDAAALARSGLSGVGVLDTSRHPSMHAGDWIVFSHRYPGYAGAEAAAVRLVAAGHTGAYPIEVAPPGGI